MRSDPTLSRLAVRSMHFTAATAVTCAMLLAAPDNARASGSDCTAVQIAVALQSKTPFHATVTKVPTQAGAFATEKDESVWIGNKMYLTLGKSWHGAPMSPDNAITGVTGGNLPFSACERLADESIGGQATSVYAAKMGSGEHVKLYISTKSGLILRDIVDEEFMIVTADFDYANVRAPAMR